MLRQPHKALLTKQPLILFGYFWGGTFPYILDNLLSWTGSN